MDWVVTWWACCAEDDRRRSRRRRISRWHAWSAGLGVGHPDHRRHRIGHRPVADPAGDPSGGSAGLSTSVAGENLIAYELDRLFRAERRPNADLDYPRAEAARILLTTASHRGMLPEDRTYLVRLVAAQTGLSQPDAERRVDDVAARAKENIARARKSAVIFAFTAGAAALLGAAAAWFAACAGGRVRDGELSSHGLWDWRRSGRRSWPSHHSSAGP